MFSGNLHPILVHFPVALITIYPFVVIAALVFKKYRIPFIWLSFVFLLIGSAFLPISEETGESFAGVVANIAPEVFQALERHVLFAEATVALALVALALHSIVLLMYEKRIVGFFDNFGKKYCKEKLCLTVKGGYQYLLKFKKFVFYFLLFPVSLLLLGAIGLTGSTGGALTHSYYVGAVTCLEIAHPLQPVAEAILPLEQRLDEWQQMYRPDASFSAKQLFEELCGGKFKK